MHSDLRNIKRPIGFTRAELDLIDEAVNLVGTNFSNVARVLVLEWAKDEIAKHAERKAVVNG